MKKAIENKVSVISNEIYLDAVKAAERKIEEETGYKVRVTSLYPLGYDVLSRDLIHHVACFKPCRHFSMMPGRKNFAIYCHSYGFRSYDFGKEMTFYGKVYKLVGFAESLNVKYLLLLGERNGLYVKKVVNVK